jgi:hypothetical protein
MRPDVFAKKGRHSRGLAGTGMMILSRGSYVWRLYGLLEGGVNTVKKLEIHHREKLYYD